MGSYQEENISSPTECEDTKTFADTSSIPATSENRRRKTPSEQNKQFDPDGKGEKAAPWNAAVYLLPFWGESWEAPCLFFVSALSVLCVCSVFPNYCSIQVILPSKLKYMRGDADQVADVQNRRTNIFSSITLLEDGEDKQRPVWSYRKRSRIELIWSGSVVLVIVSRSCFMLKLVRGTLNSIPRS